MTALAAALRRAALPSSLETQAANAWPVVGAALVTACGFVGAVAMSGF